MSFHRAAGRLVILASRTLIATSVRIALGVGKICKLVLSKAHLGCSQCMRDIVIAYSLPHIVDGLFNQSPV